jgi:hypothetical protein
VGMQFSMGQIWPPGMLGSNPQFQDQSQKQSIKLYQMQLQKLYGYSLCYESFEYVRVKFLGYGVTT